MSLLHSYVDGDGVGGNGDGGGGQWLASDRVNVNQAHPVAAVINGYVC